MWLWKREEVFFEYLKQSKCGQMNFILVTRFCSFHRTEIWHFFIFPSYATIFKSNHKCSFRVKQKGGQLPAGSADDSVLSCMYWWLSVGTIYVRKQILFHKRTVQTSVSMHWSLQHRLHKQQHKTCCDDLASSFLSFILFYVFDHCFLLQRPFSCTWCIKSSCINKVYYYY